MNCVRQFLPRNKKSQKWTQVWWFGNYRLGGQTLDTPSIKGWGLVYVPSSLNLAALWLLQPGEFSRHDAVCLLQWGHARQYRDIDIWNPEPLCSGPPAMKLPCCEEAHVQKPCTCALVSGLCRHRAQVPNGWVKILAGESKVQLSSHPNVHVFLSWGPRYQGAETGHPHWALPKLLIYRIHELHEGFFDVTKFLDDLLCGKSASTSLPLSPLLRLWWGPPAPERPHCLRNNSKGQRQFKQHQKNPMLVSTSSQITPRVRQNTVVTARRWMSFSK